jgi:uncharacterized spore protein YtfJ
MGILNGAYSFSLGFTLGFGSGFFSRELINPVRAMILPSSKWVVKSMIKATEMSRETMAKVGDHLSDMIAEVKYELQEEMKNQGHKKIVKKKKHQPKKPSKVSSHEKRKGPYVVSSLNEVA